MESVTTNALAERLAISGWTERSEHWLAQSAKKPRYRIPNEKALEPLVLCGHGVSLRVERGVLVIHNGFTHYPQARQVLHLFKGDKSLPSRIIVLDVSGYLSFDVLAWLADQSISLVQINWNGEAISTVGGMGSPFDPERVAWQIATRGDPLARVEFASDLISAKIRAGLETLRNAVPQTDARDLGIRLGEATMARLDRRQLKTIFEIRIAEARAACAYFRAWRGLPLRWKNTKRRPVPENWLTAQMRRSYGIRGSVSARHASHPINAMLNYAYAALGNQIQAELITGGYDPTRGVMRESRPDAKAFVYDMIEPRRPAVAAILKFVAANAFTAADFAIRSDGACRLAPQLAKRVCEVVGPTIWKNAL